MKLKKKFCQFPNPWTLRVSGMGGYPSKCEKKSKSLHPNVHICGDQYVICGKQAVKKRLKEMVVSCESHTLRPEGLSEAKLLVRLLATSCRSVAGGRTLQGTLR
jgi:hypothetical protein